MTTNSVICSIHGEIARKRYYGNAEKKMLRHLSVKKNQSAGCNVKVFTLSWFSTTEEIQKKIQDWQRSLKND